MVQIGGKYKFEKHENFENFLKTIGVSEEKIKVYLGMDPETEITEDGDKLTIKVQNLGKTREVTFTLGEEYEDTVAGILTKNVTRREGETLRTKAKTSERDYCVIRNFTDTEMIMEIKPKDCDVVAKLISKRV